MVILTTKIDKKETVNHPAHYNVGKFEVIDIIEDWDLGFHLGNAIKYIARAKHKDNELEDLKKARWYLNRKIFILKAKAIITINPKVIKCNNCPNRQYPMSSRCCQGCDMENYRKTMERYQSKNNE